MTMGILKIDFGDGIRTYEVEIEATISPRIEEYRIHSYNLEKFDDVKANTPEGDYSGTINRGADIQFKGYVVGEKKVKND